MPNVIEQICVKVIQKPQNNAEDSMELNHGHVFVLWKLLFYVKGIKFWSV